MKPQTYQLPEETIKELSKFHANIAKKNRPAKQGIVNIAILKYIKTENKSK